MGRLVAVGDIHGCAETLRLLLERLNLAAGDSLVAIGDLSSRGIDSRSVHQQLIDLEASGVRVITLLGNHEAFLLGLQRFLGADVDLSHLPESIFQDAEMAFLLRRNGCWATLKSYGFEGVDDKRFWIFDRQQPRHQFERIVDEIAQMDWRLPQQHLDFLSRSRLYHIERNCLFVHAGMDPGAMVHGDAHRAVKWQIEEDPKELCWNRNWLGTTPAFPELLIHGHTPLPCLYQRLEDTDPWKDDELLFQSVVHNGSLNLDSGAFLDAGHLTAVDIPEDGDLRHLQFLRVPRVDPVEKDRLWFMNHVS